MLRNLRFANYFGQCFPPVRGPRAQLRLSSLVSYKVRFSSVAIHFSSGLPHVPDRFILPALNCRIVALCSVHEESEKVSGVGRGE